MLMDFIGSLEGSSRTFSVMVGGRQAAMHSNVSGETLSSYITVNTTVVVFWDEDDDKALPDAQEVLSLSALGH